MKRRDFLLTLAVACGAFLLLSLWPFPLLHPGAWKPVAAAAGLRPPEDPFCGVYRGLLALIFKTMPTGGALPAVQLAARALVAATTGIVYAVLCDFCVPALRPEPRLAGLFRPMGRLVAGMAALVFLCLDPVWRAGQALSSTTVFLFLLALSGWLFLRFAMRRGLLSLYLSLFLLGVLSGECMLGVVPSVAALFCLRHLIATSPSDTLADEFMWEMHALWLTLSWLAGCAASVGLGVGLFLKSGGMVAVEGGDSFGLLVFHLRKVWELFCAAAEPSGWMLGLFGCVVPFVVAVMLLRYARKDDSFLPDLVGVTYVLVGAVSFSQMIGANSFWPSIGTYQSELIPSETLRTFFLLFALFAFVLTLVVFGVNALCRNYRSIAHWRFPDSMEVPAAARLAAWLGRSRKWRIRGVLAVLILIPMAAAFSRRLPRERAMMSVMGTYVDEVLHEMDGRDTIFTDGSFDCLVELKALEAGRPVRAISMMAPNTGYERAIRQRAAENDEDVALFANDAASALRTWVETDSPRLRRCAVQLGFEYWKRFGKSPPPFSGVLALPGGESSGLLAEGRAAGNRLSDEALEISRRRNPPGTSDRELKRLYPFVLWRLSRIMRLRAQADAVERRYADSIRATQQSEELDGVNYELAAMRLSSSWLRRSKKGGLTPREGLVIGLARADFTLAADYAAKVLRTDPNDSRAHFATGMKYLLSEDYLLAEHHLRRCLEGNPGEPAALNNLANAELKLGKTAEAEAHALQALNRLPENAAIRSTLERIRQVAAKSR